MGFRGAVGTLLPVSQPLFHPLATPSQVKPLEPDGVFAGDGQSRRSPRLVVAELPRTPEGT